MPIDNANYISEFDTALPLDSDPVTEGNNNFQHIKQVCLNSLPNIDAPMTESSATLNGIEQRLTDVEANNVSLQAVFDTIWPVGSIYFSEYNIGLPAHFINYGTWAAIASDRRLIRHVDFSGGPNSSIGWTPGANALSARNVRGWVRTA